MRQTTLPRLRALVLALALLCALTLPVYADEPALPAPAPPPAATPTVSGVTIDPSTPAALDVGKNLTLTALVAYQNPPEDPDESAKLDRTVIWTSASPSIATVDDKGVVTAVAPGEAKITAASKADPKKTDECTVAVSGVTLSKTSITLLVGRTESLTYSTFGTAAGKSIVWTTSNPSVAEVFGGSISAHYEGTATITATVNGTGYTAECSVTVKRTRPRPSAPLWTVPAPLLSPPSSPPCAAAAPKRPAAPSAISAAFPSPPGRVFCTMAMSPPTHRATA